MQLLRRKNRIHIEMKNLRKITNYWPLANPPKNEYEETVVSAFGFVRLATGQWVLPGPSFSPPIEILEKYGPGHRCRACRSFFRSKRARDPYCLSCRTIMHDKRRELEAILCPVLDAPAQKQHLSRQKVEEELACHEPGCGWQGNRGRYEPQKIQQLLEYLPGWIETSHRHFMRHVFWNRFPGPRFWRKNYPGSFVEQLDNYQHMVDQGRVFQF